jgi:hypothetical protein
MHVFITTGCRHHGIKAAVTLSASGIAAEIPQGRHRADRGIGAERPVFCPRAADKKDARLFLQFFISYF